MNRVLLTALTATAVLVPTASATAAPGDLDSAFSGDGRAIVDLGGDDFGEGVAIQPDGKIIVLGLGADRGSGDFVVTRLNADGSPDPTFSGDGRIRFSFAAAGFSSNDEPKAVALQPDGKIVVAGWTTANGVPGNHTDAAIARLTPSGTLDPDFNDTGKQTIDYGNENDAADVAVQADGKIIVGGTAFIGADDDFTVSRLTAAGQPDPKWDGDGRTPTHFGARERLRGVSISPDGSVTAVGLHATGTTQDTAIARYTAGGVLESAFSEDGKRVVSFGAFDEGSDVVAQPDGQLVVAVSEFATPRDNTIVTRVTPAGDIDVSFGDDGRTVAPGAVDNSPEALALTSSGHIVVAGQTGTAPAPTDFQVLELDRDGQPARTFSGDGLTPIDFGNAEFASDVAVSGDRAVVVGSSAVRDVHIAAVTVDAAAGPVADQPVAAPAPASDTAAPAPAPAADSAPPAAPTVPVDTRAPVLSKLALKARGRTAEKGVFRLSEKAKVVVTVQRRISRRFRRFRTIKLSGRTGANAFTVKKLKPGAYRVTLKASDAAGNRSKALRASFSLKR